MKLSIITATYNSEKTIQHCLASIKNQTYGKVEHIIIDGKSTDQTLKIIEDYAKEKTNVKIISESDKGIYDALNKGIHHATGDIIGFLHSDDEFQDSSTLKKVINAFEFNRADGVYGDLNYVNAEDSSRIVRYWKSKPFESNMLLKGWMPPHPTLFLKKEVYKKHGIFDLAFKIVADYDFILRIFQDQSLRFFYLPENICKMRIGGASSASRNLKKKMKEDLKAMRNNDLPNPYSTLVRKNVSKLNQFIKR